MIIPFVIQIVLLFQLYGRQMDVETTLCAYLVVALLLIKQDVVLVRKLTLWTSDGR